MRPAPDRVFGGIATKVPFGPIGSSPDPGSPWQHRRMPEPDRSRLQRNALFLEYATIAWNLGEAVLTIGLGIAAAILALIGFGTASSIEVVA